jgi:hypothetical protein
MTAKVIAGGVGSRSTAPCGAARQNSTGSADNEPATAFSIGGVAARLFSAKSKAGEPSPQAMAPNQEER